MKKAQISTEFIFALASIFIALIIMLAINFDKGNQLNDLKNFVGGREECLTISNTINSLYVNGPLSSAELTIYSKANIYDNSRIEITSNSTGELIAQCFYTARVFGNRTNVTGTFIIKIDNQGRAMVL